MIVKTNSIQAILTAFKQQLTALYPQEEASAIFYWCAEEILNKKRINIQQKDLVSESELLKFFNALKRLKTGEPVQYVFGYTYFDGLKLKVTPDVLIPRPETEELVSIVSQHCISSGLFSIADLCTGSGCIALALAKRFPQAKITATDISIKALKIANENAVANDISNVKFIESDILKPAPATLFEEEKCDIIVSNPPYVTETEKQAMHPNVVKHEPHTALFVPNDNQLKFYKAIAKHAVQYLSSDGKLFLEINENYDTQTAELLQQSGFSKVELIQDFRNKPRFLYAC
ncbi:MAG: peptide chain release factor N(5)-glutamine methyltransferase [Bacteroidales bacterium]|jgi:release factor glutamine methyltransferase|nr:peptide chain release factor N(5)-glutamine methyltransferase [Bacteroidales bacterium]